MKKIVTPLLLGSFILGSCSHMDSKRIPASVSSKSDLVDYLDLLQNDINSPLLSSQECVDKLDEYYQKLFTVRGDDIQIQELVGEDLKEMVEKSFHARVAIKERLTELTVKSETDALCLERVRDTMRALRTMEDYLVELYMFKTKSESQDPDQYRTFHGESPYFLVNPKYAHQFSKVEDIQSGDVILSRGNAFTSAAIAKIGEMDAQFSHLSFVYRDNANELHTTEAHIEIGNVTAPFEDHINEKNARSVLFRYENYELAHDASERVYNEVKKRQDDDDIIEYDFGMDYHKADRLFCSEVIYRGFDLASNGEVDIPQHKTTFGKELIPFLQGLGIDVNKKNIDSFDTFGPGDIEYDTRFELIAEWKNPAKMENIRMKDAILTKMFEWMEKDGFEFHPPVGVWAKAKIAWLARRLPLPSFKKQLPLNMKTKQLKMFFTLDLIGERMQEHLEEVQKEKKRPLTPIEMYELLEEYKVADAKQHAAYKKWQRSQHGPRDDRPYTRRVKSSDWYKYFRP